MKTYHVALMLFSASILQAEVVTFDKVKSGRLPEGWLAGATGRGSPRWSVVEESTAPSQPSVLKQFGEGTFPWCVLKGISLTNGFVEVKFKPISGKEDQAGGLIWRWKDGDDYYVTRANALEDNVTIYHTIKGVRSAFKSANVKVLPNQWHSLRADFHGSHFIVTFDGIPVIETEDESIQGAGSIGVWTKADSVTFFDDFKYGEK